MQIFDAMGNIVLDGSDMTFRFVGQYSFTTSQTSDVIVSVPGVAAGTHFATCDSGFPVVETNQVRIHPEFGANGLTVQLYIFRV